MPSSRTVASLLVVSSLGAVAGCSKPPGISGDFESWEAARVAGVPPPSGAPYSPRVRMVASLSEEDRRSTLVRLEIHAAGLSIVRCEERAKWAEGSAGVLYPLSLDTCKWVREGADDPLMGKHCKITANPTTLVVRKGSDEMTVRSPLQLRFAPDRPDSPALCANLLGVDVEPDARLERMQAPVAKPATTAKARAAMPTPTAQKKPKK